jgi:hypothetical protein
MVVRRHVTMDGRRAKNQCPDSVILTLSASYCIVSDIRENHDRLGGIAARTHPRIELEKIMSDGPHRSLPMRPGWKKVAEYAANEVFASQDVCDVVMAALEWDWRRDISPAFIGCIQDVLDGTTLFGEDRLQALEDLHPSTAGCEMGNTLLDHVVYAVSDGKLGDAALQEAVIRTLTDWSSRCTRQVEEHYLRKSSAATTKDVGSRIKEAIQKAPFTALASRLLNPKSMPALRLAKHDGLDDGVPL